MGKTDGKLGAAFDAERAGRRAGRGGWGVYDHPASA